MKITTIKLSSETKDRLEKLRSYKRESYEEILQKLLAILNVCRINPTKAAGRLANIDKINRSMKKSRKKVQA